ncbi:sigma-70 family RNA polymerase sigma factor [Seonamhaeicola aphaedonensis]|uniref:RNA polymerase RpoS-like sigma 38 subunit n=1 Tax=Seonamhaeicola aphaedonensis TaxID=1461338 RepID=A0A3D9HJB7_9FLAO|nr:RNA polymerase sigma factor RpoD/SigA [Seonamhaeicola aphaedonensis]RED49590.1 RNA polymerase RpoS-like sigma 38 subunit [Seonamhaeicola aphaedonensis]
MKSLHISKQITLRNDESIAKYLVEIGKFSLITAEREVELAALIRKGNQGALNELTKANLRFVVSVAKQYQNQGLPLSDLINEGNLGLLTAAKRFDETRGFKFISYAVWWIRQSVIQALAQNSRVVRLPLNKIGVLNKIKESTAFFEQNHNRAPSVDEISDIIEVSVLEIELCMKNAKYSVSMDAPLSEDSKLCLNDTFGTDEFDTPDKSLLIDSLQIDLDTVINSLSERESEIIKLHYGISGVSPMSLSEIGKKLEITRERVRQIKELALNKLKKSGGSNLLKYL